MARAGKQREGAGLRSRLRYLGILGLVGALGWLAGCSTTSSNRAQDQRLREQAAQATEQAKREAQQAAAQARVAAAEAERKVNDIAAGVQQGWKSGKPAAGRNSPPVGINTADKASLEQLPGVGAGTAQRIMERRPYAAKRELVTKGAVSPAEYNRIAALVTVD
jgi:DNA uptake protein ComE-like DNA-binding protein